MKKRKKNLLTRLKHKAPSVPEFTCSHIDRVIEYIANSAKSFKPITRTQAKALIKKLERLRKNNDRLRESGRYWYDACRQVLLKLLD